MSFIPVTPEINLASLVKGARFIIPAVTNGNVPQLSVDLLLSTLAHQYLGTFHTAHVLPCVGLNAIEPPSTAATKSKSKKTAATPSTLVTSTQLFYIPSLHLLLLQQRAPCILGRSAAYVQELRVFASSIEISEVIILTSSAAMRMKEEELDATHPISFFAIEGSGNKLTSSTTTTAEPLSPSSSPLITLLHSTLGWNSLHFNTLNQDEQPLNYDQLNSAEDNTDDRLSSRTARVHLQEQKGQDRDDDVDSSIAPKPIPIPGLGITRPFYESVTSTSSAPFTTLFLHMYINEGANSTDAMMMTQQIYTFLFVQQQQSTRELAASKDLTEPQEMSWKVPSSWNALFGNEPEESMYL